MSYRNVKSILLLLLVFALMLSMAIACDTDDDDDDDDNDTSGDDDDDDDDNDTGEPAGPTPVLSDLNPYPETVFPGEVLNMNFHFTDGDGDLFGGAIHFLVGGVEVKTKQISYDPGMEGHFTEYIDTLAAWGTGVLELSVYVVDGGGAQSNTVSANFTLRGENTPPILSNLRFEPNPVCNADGSAFSIIFDFIDPDGNIGGGSLAVTFDGGFPQQFIISPEFEATQGTIPIDANITGDAPDGYDALVEVQLSDNQGAVSNKLSGDLTFQSAACSE